MLKKVFLLILLSFVIYSCTSEDDICLSGDTTPRLKVKFKTKEGKLKTLDSVFVKVDYGSGAQQILVRGKTDSLLIPLRVDESSFTDIYVSKSKLGIFSKIKLNYTISSEYVSPACGIKRIYDNIDPVVEIPNEVTAVEKNQNQIANESKTHLFFIF